ncbi:MAG: hypothetical protein ABS81_25345 [Pseudonocardia sp. SCN 72-86]|nr:MAG: hypothetical protein ABS81_25345 [Pseudonocardia sp. SCN 72-86]
MRHNSSARRTSSPNTPPPPALPRLRADLGASLVVFLVAVPLSLGIALASGARCLPASAPPLRWPRSTSSSAAPSAATPTADVAVLSSAIAGAAIAGAEVAAVAVGLVVVVLLLMWPRLTAGRADPPRATSRSCAGRFTTVRLRPDVAYRSARNLMVVRAAADSNEVARGG